MVRLDRQRQNLPTPLSTLALDQLPAACCHWSHKHRLAALGAPDEVIDDQVDAMLVSLVLHVEIVACSDNKINICAQKAWAKAREKPAESRALKGRRLALG